MIRKTLTWVAAITAVTSVLAGCEVIAGIEEKTLVTSAADSGTPVDAPLRIVATAPLSGSVQSVGAEVKLGLQACVDRRNRGAGGVNGRRLVVDVKDDADDAKQAEAAARASLADDPLGFVSSWGSAQSATVAPVASAANKLFFAPMTSVNEGLRGANTPKTVFTMRPSIDQEVSAILDRIRADNGNVLPALAGNPTATPPTTSTLAVVADDGPFGTAAVASLKAVLTRRELNADDLRVYRFSDLTSVDSAADSVKTQAGRSDASSSKRFQVILFAEYESAGTFIRLLRSKAAADATTQSKAIAATARFYNTTYVGPEGLLVELGKPPREVPGAASTFQFQNVLLVHPVPSFGGQSPGIQEYLESLKATKPDAIPGYTSLEANLGCRLFLQGIDAAKGDYSTANLIRAFESLASIDLGIGVTGSFAADKHTAFDTLWLSEISPAGGEVGYVVKARWDALAGLRDP